MTPRFLAQGDRGLLVEFAAEISPSVAEQVRVLVMALTDANDPSIEELIPAYRSVLIRYNPLLTHPENIKELVLKCLERKEQSRNSPKVTEIPVCYQGEFALDLASVSSHTGLSAEQIIARHSAPQYLIYMLGFTPGFPYLGGLPDELACPRLKEPRTLIPQGSVGIADRQTGIYPLASPGGWQIIGRTPLKLFDPEAAVPILLRGGDYLRFVPIDQEEFKRISHMTEKREYIPKTYPKGGGF